MRSLARACVRAHVHEYVCAYLCCVDTQVPFLCNAADFPPTNTSPAPAPSPAPTGMHQNSSLPDGRQHCFDGTFTILALIGLVYAIVFIVFCCLEWGRYRRFR